MRQQNHIQDQTPHAKSVHFITITPSWEILLVLA